MLYLGEESALSFVDLLKLFEKSAVLLGFVVQVFFGFFQLVVVGLALGFLHAFELDEAVLVYDPF